MRTTGKADAAALLAALLFFIPWSSGRTQQGGPVLPPRTQAPTGDAEIHLTVLPRRQLIERRHGLQLVNFDLLVSNSGMTAYRLVCLRLKVFDRSGELEVERELNENGKPPALDSIGPRLVKPGGVLDIYQPFYSFPQEVKLERMRFELLFMKEGHAAPPVAIDADARATVDASPVPYTPVPFCLPLRGLTLVHDGHDFDSHHRRFDLVDRFKSDPASALSANLYAYDFMNTTAEGALFRGDSNRKESWLTYGKAIFAPAPGVVVHAVDHIPENTFAPHGGAQIPPDAAEKDPQGFGNYVSIRHSDGRVSWLLHMQPGSVAVKEGARVEAGQLVGRVGFSGDSLFPHLHYNVTEGAAYPSQGVPSYFKNFTWVLGSRRIAMAAGQVDTGDLLDGQQVCR